jgi:hypothetical protein
VEELTAIGRRLVEHIARNGEAMRLLLWEVRAAGAGGPGGTGRPQMGRGIYPQMTQMNADERR